MLCYFSMYMSQGDSRCRMSGELWGTATKQTRQETT